MRSSLNARSSRIAILASGLAIVAAACGGGSGGGGTGGRDAGRTDSGAGGAAVDAGGDARVDAVGTGGAPVDAAGTGGRSDAATDGGAGGAATDGGAGGAATDGGAGVGGAAGAIADGGSGGADGGALSLPWHAFLPLAAAAPGSSAAMGTTLDLTANHYDGTYFGPTITFANAALNLSGPPAQELVVVPPRAGAPAVDVTGSYSVSVWVTLTNVAGYRTVVSGEGFNIASFFLQKRADTGAWAYTVPAADSIAAPGCIAPGPQVDGGPVQTPVIPIAGTQYHLVATRDATAGLHVLYVNGVESGRNTCTAGWADTGILGIGHGVFAAGRGDFVTGSIADVGVINRALTAAEVAALFARGRTNPGTPDAGADTGAADAPVDAPADVPAATDAPADVPAATDAGASDAAADTAAGG